MADVKDVAKYFINLSVESTPYAITPLKLQKLIYYAQGFHLMEYGVPLFNDNLQAWVHGPVVRRIYELYRRYGYHTIPSEPFDNAHFITGEPLLTEEELGTINRVWGLFGNLDGKTLEELTHQEDPWIATDINDNINNDLIEEYFNNYYMF